MNAPTDSTVCSTRVSVLKRRGAWNNRREGFRRSNASMWFLSAVLVVLLLGSRNSAAAPAALAAPAAPAEVETVARGAYRRGTNSARPPEAGRVPTVAREEKGAGGRPPYQASKASFGVVSSNKDEDRRRFNMPRIAGLGIRRPDWSAVSVVDCCLLCYLRSAARRLDCRCWGFDRGCWGMRSGRERERKTADRQPRYVPAAAYFRCRVECGLM